MPITIGSMGEGGEFEAVRIEALVNEPAVASHDGSTNEITHTPGGDTGAVMTTEPDTLNTLFGDITFIIYSLIRGGFQVGIGADGKLYFGRGHWVGDEDGLLGRDGQGVTQVYLSSEGKIVAGGEAITIDQEGLTVNKGSEIQFSTESAYVNRLRYGGHPDLSALGGYGGLAFLSYPDTGVTNLVANPDFETGDFTNWTATGTFAVISSDKHGGTYCAEATGSSAATLTSARISATDLTSYLVKGWTKVNGNNFSIVVKFYDHASAGSLIEYRNIHSISAVDVWQDFQDIIVSPAGTLSAEIVITFDGDSSDSYGRIDDLELGVFPSDFSYNIFANEGSLFDTRHITLRRDSGASYGATASARWLFLWAEKDDFSIRTRSPHGIGADFDVIIQKLWENDTDYSFIPHNPSYMASGVSTGTLVNTGSDVLVTKVYIPAPIVFETARIEITTAVNPSTTGVGLYDIAGDLVISGTVSSATNGYKAITVGGANAHVGPGWYWFAWTATSSLVQARMHGVNANAINLFNQGTPIHGIAANASVAGVLPATLGGVTAGTRDVLSAKFECA